MPDIYVRPFRKSTIIKRKNVCVKDIADVSTPMYLKNKIENICVKKITSDKKATYVISIIEIIDAITKEVPSATIYNVGEMDSIIQYLPNGVKINPLLEWGKVAGISCIIFAGATVAIMAYQTDVSLAKTFSMINKIFTGQVEENPLWMTIPYSVGLPLGVLIFFNHIGNKKLTDDPTPIEVELNTFKEDVEDAVVETVTAKRRGQ